MSHPAQLQQLFSAAVSHHQAGQLRQAEALYCELLAAVPNQPDALHLLGLVHYQSGRLATAIELIGRAVQFAPQAPDPHGNLAIVLFDANRLDDAERAAARACELAPRRADLHARLCLIRHRQGDPHGAALAGRRAVELQPDHAEAWSNLAMALAAAKKHDEALNAANRAVALAPNRPEPHVNLAFVHEQARRSDDAVASLRKAIEINPNYPLSHRNLAALYDRMNEIERAIPPLRRALEINPRDVEGWNNLSALLRRTRDHAGALEAADRALALAPNHASSHGNRGLALLALGDYPRGFAEYEWRWRCDNFTTRPRDFERPMWDGSDPSGRTIFVHAEQGYGDTIQFARFIPMLAARGATVLLECTLPLRALLGSVAGAHKVVPAGMKPPDFDLHVPLLSLPRIFGATLDTLPRETPYLQPDAQRRALWKQRIDDAASGFRIGLIWAGNAKPDPARTCPLEHFEPLASIEGVTFFSLQKEAARIPDPSPLPLIDLAPDLKDFTDTAAAMMEMDLIVTIDTAGAHLAGALGCRTWTLLPWAADWRWLEDRDDSPWYPTMRLFRQPTRGDWDSVIAQVADELPPLIERRK